MRDVTTEQVARAGTNLQRGRTIVATTASDLCDAMCPAGATRLVRWDEPELLEADDGPAQGEQDECFEGDRDGTQHVDVAD